MPLMLFPRCLRNRDDCTPFMAVDAAPEGTTEEQLMAVEYEPISFVCSGCIRPEDRGLPQDAFRLCWKTPMVDEMGDYDESDLAHTALVVNHALAVLATRRANNGVTQVPLPDGGLEDVRTMQADAPHVLPGMQAVCLDLEARKITRAAAAERLRGLGVEDDVAAEILDRVESAVAETVTP